MSRPEAGSGAPRAGTPYAAACAGAPRGTARAGAPRHAERGETPRGAARLLAVGRGRCAAALGILAFAAVALAAPARAGTFRVSQCGAVDQGGASPRGYQADLWTVHNGWPDVDCVAGHPGIRVGTPNFRLLNDWSTTLSFGLPGSMPGTSVRTAWLDWRFNPQSPSTNPAYFSVESAGARLLVAQPGNGTYRGAAGRLDVPAGARGLDMSIWCSPLNGPGWCNWPGPLLDLRGLTVELEERGEPAAAADGALLAAGPRAGVEPVEVRASDADSGVRDVAVTLGGTPVGSLTPADGCRDDRLPPCPRALRGTVDVDTTRVPDGPRRLRLAVTDAAGNVRTLGAGMVLVANQPPRVDTVPPPSGPVPAPPTAPGAGAAPAPSTAPPAPFPPNPLTGRGHVPNGRNASERARVRAWLELPATRRRGNRDATTHRNGRTGLRTRPRVRRRRSATVPYGVRVRIRGRLVNRNGRPIGRAALAAVRREPGGPWKAVTGVRTRPNGRFTAFTRIGPSQELRFVYYPYGDSTHGRRGPKLRVRVRRE